MLVASCQTLQATGLDPNAQPSLYGCRGGLPPKFHVPELKQLETRNSTLREPTTNSRGEFLPEWYVA